MQAGRRDDESVGGRVPTAMSARDERTWSVLSHLSMFLNLFTGFLGAVAALIVWLVYRDRSEKVTFHALQSTFYQAGWLVVLVAGWAPTGLLMGVLIGVLIGFLLVPAMVVVSVVPFAHAARTLLTRPTRWARGRSTATPWATPWPRNSRCPGSERCRTT